MTSGGTNNNGWPQAPHNLYEASIMGGQQQQREATTDPPPTPVHNNGTATTNPQQQSHTHRHIIKSQNSTVQHREYGNVDRDPFFSFVPQLLCLGCSMAQKEAGVAKRVIFQGPSFLQHYLTSSVQFYKTNPKILYKEIISGFTVAIMQVPESIAFSFVAGVPPLSGLHATFWMATITGICGGKPGMISGAAGALAVVVADLTVNDGVLSYLQDTPTRTAAKQRQDVLYMTMVWCGIAQIIFAWLRLAKIVRLIPETGMIGFMNGLAIIIFKAQLPAFQKCTAAEFFVDCTVEGRQWLTFEDDTWVLILSLIHVFSCMAIMKFFPLLTKVGRIIPASLVGLLVGTLFEHTLFRQVFHVGTRTVQETAQMSGSLPKFDWPQIPDASDSRTIAIIAQFALTLAAIGGVESVLTLQACNEITDTVPKMRDSNQELFAQGLANFVSGLFRAMGGDAMIGQSTINIMNGARHRVSSTCSGLFMLLFVIALSGFIELLPVSTLTGVLFMVVLSTFQWKTFQILRYGRFSDSAVVVLVTLIAVFFNLAVAIAAGIVFSALVHAWDSGEHVDADITYKPMAVKKTKGTLNRVSSAEGESDDDDNDDGVDDGTADDEEIVDCKYVHVKGSIFFGSARHFVAFFNIATDPATVVIDLKDALVIDHSAVAAIGGITHRYAKVGKRVLLVNVPHKSHGRLHRTGNHQVLEDQIVTHPAELFDVERGVVKAVEHEGSTRAADNEAAGKVSDDDVEVFVKVHDGDQSSDKADTQSIISGYAGPDGSGIEVEQQLHERPRNTYGGWDNLPMFQAGTEDVGSELGHLLHQSGRFKVHDIGDKKAKKHT